MDTFFFWCAIGAVAGTVFGSFFEWTLHRYIMHRSFKWFRFPYERHALVHHRIFKADHTYHLVNEPDKKTIPMAWWSGPAIVAACQLPFLIWSLFSHKWGILCGATMASTLYFTAYEYMHWCMHLPKKRHVERSGIFFRLNGHHLLHHRYMRKNFNVVLPFADLCCGTLLMRSKVAFAQAQGRSVPDVQPGGKNPFKILLAAAAKKIA
jgi:hypothetical protein